MSTHYILMGGSSGCLPDYCEVFDTREDATEDAIDTYELCSKDALRLSENGILYAGENVAYMGADYVSITLCTCDNPSIHSDSAE